MACEQPSRRLADLRNAKRVDKALERNSPALVDRGHQVARAELAPAFALGDHLGIEAEDVARLADQPVLPESSDVLLAEPLDIEAMARHEMPQPLDRLRGAYQPAGAAPRHLARLAHREAAADRAVVGELVAHGVLRTPVEHDGDDLRDHVAGALHNDGVADADVLTLDLVLVVQGGALHAAAAARDRF